MTPREIVERYQRLLRAALERLDAQRLPDEVDETFCDMLHGALRGAGATDADVDAFASYLVTMVVESTERGSEDREMLFELISRHFAQTDMTVRVSRDDCTLRVEFPNRPKTH